MGPRNLLPASRGIRAEGAGAGRQGVPHTAGVGSGGEAPATMQRQQGQAEGWYECAAVREGQRHPMHVAASAAYLTRDGLGGWSD